MEIEIIRKEIDEIDLRIVELLESRSERVLRIGALKSNLQLPVKDIGRESEVINGVRRHTRVEGVRDNIERIFKTILKESKSLQTTLTGEKLK